MSAPGHGSRNNYAQHIESEDVVDQGFNGGLLQVFHEGTRGEIQLNGHESSSTGIHSHGGIDMQVPEWLGECGHVVNGQI